MIEQYPHCDQSVLHAPGECEFCDAHPEWQELRKGWGIAYTGKTPVPLYLDGPMQAPCPSDYRRGEGQAHTWGGNRPTRVPDTELPEETGTSRVLYPRESRDRPPPQPTVPRWWWSRWLG